MDIAALLLELSGRLPPLPHEAVDGLDADRLVWQPSSGANTIGWLVWHLARVQDHHVSELTGDDQSWVTGDWAAGFGLDADPSNTGYGHGPDEVLAVRPESSAALVDYLAATDARATEFIAGLTPDALDEIVDRRWDPPVTLGVRLVSIADDALQHVGQAAYVRGLLDG
jgi:uncharacterized damage-inducible protein DinB